MGPVEIVFLAVPLAMVVLLLFGLRRTTRTEEAEEWAAAHGVTLTQETRELVDRYLYRSRKFKLTGAVIGIVLPLGSGLPGAEMIAGYLAGALLAEAKQPRLTPGEHPTASLVPRSLDDYLPSFVIPVLRSSIVVAALLGAAYLFGPRRTPEPDLDAGFAIAFVAALFVPLAVEGFLRKIVGRPQATGDAHLIAVDDAIRSSSLHAVGGAGVAIVLLIIGGIAWAVGQTSDIDAVRWALPIAGVASALSGMTAWLRLGGETSWKVRRSSKVLGAAS